MNVTDIVVVVIILISGLFALMRGFVKEVLSVAGWVGAAFATLYLFHIVAPWSRKFIAVPWLADAAAGLAIFVVSLVILSTISHVIARRVHQSSFSALDKSLGLVFGLLRGAVVVCLGYLALGWAVTSPDQYPSWIKGARTRPLVEQGARLIEQLVPENARHKSARALDNAQSKVRQGLEAQRALEQLTHPEPKVDAPKDREGYKVDERREMDRVIQTNR